MSAESISNSPSVDWRLRQQRYGLVGEVCPRCDEKIFPPTGVCPHCAAETKTPFVFANGGEVYANATAEIQELPAIALIAV